MRGPRTADVQAAARRLRRPVRLTSAAAIFVLPLAGCAALSHGTLNAAGPIAADERRLLIEVLIVLAFVIGPVLLLAPLFAWHYRLSNTRSAFRPRWNFYWPLEGLIWLPPTAIVVGLAILLWGATHRLDPYRPLPAAEPPLQVQVVALDWKWLFIYPQAGVATVNELDVPVGRPVHLELTSGTVMQSVLMPQLAGQIYAMAGMSTQLNFAADRPGVYLGENSQYNGTDFQNDKFRVVALSPADYDRWRERARRAPPLDAQALKGLLARARSPAPQVFSAPPADLYRRLISEMHHDGYANPETLAQ